MLHRFLFLLLGGVLLFTPLSAQDSVIDSLKSELKISLGDSSNMELSLKIGRSYFYSDKDSSMVYIRRGIELAEKLNIKPKLAYGKRILGIIYLSQDAYDPGLNNFLEALELFEEESDSLGIGNVLNDIGTVYLYQEIPEEGIPSLKRARAIATTIGELELLGQVNHNLAITLDMMDKEEEALEVFMANAALQDTTGNRYYLASTHNSIAEVLRNMGRFEEALPHLRQAINLKTEFEDVRGLGIVQLNYGNWFLDQNLLDSAEYYLQLSIESTQEAQATSYIVKARKSLAEIRLKQGRPTEAYTLLRNAMEVSDSLEKSQRKDLIANLMSVYQADQSSQEIALLNAENKVARSELGRKDLLLYGLIAVLILGIVTILIIYRVARGRRKDNEKLTELLGQLEEQSRKIAQQNSALLNSNQELEQLYREQEGMVHMIAHDLKAPLNKSIMLASMLKAVGPLNVRQEDCVERLDKVCKEGGELIADLLDLHSVEHAESEVKPEQIDLQELLKELIQGHQAHADSKKISLKLEVPEKISLNSDPGILSRILDNLLSNAIKFSPSEKDVFLKVDRDSENILIKVKDEGPGIGPEDQKKLFGKFQRLSARPTAGESSTGLGLAIVKLLSEKLGGGIHLQSSPGKGAEFILTLKESFGKTV